MKGVFYQLKNIRRDKLVIISFFLPIIIGILLNYFDEEIVYKSNEATFGIVHSEINSETLNWLKNFGRIFEYNNLELLKEAIEEPSTDIIGVIVEENEMKTIISGDEFSINQSIAFRLPSIYLNRSNIIKIKVHFLDNMSAKDTIKPLMIVIVMLTAMFMGCAFNSMSIIGEKEDGIDTVNKVLPLSHYEYLVQKIIIGIIGGTLSAFITGFICISISLQSILPFLLLVTMSGFISAVLGILIGELATGLMIAILYLKMAMIFLVASPLVFYVFSFKSSLIKNLSYLFPSMGTFYGLMEIITNKQDKLWWDIIIVFLHSICWFIVYIIVRKFRSKSQV